MLKAAKISGIKNRDTGLFRRVDVKAVPLEDPRLADVVVDVSEGQQLRIGMGIGYAKSFTPPQSA